MGLAHAWGLALSDITFYQNQDILTSLGSIGPPEQTKKLIWRDWGIRDKEGLIDDFADVAESLNTSVKNPHIELENKAEKIRDNALNHEKTHLEKYGFTAWHASRASFLIRSGYIVGWLSAEEVWLHLEKLRHPVQKHFPDWQTYLESNIISRAVTYSRETLKVTKNRQAIQALLHGPVSKILEIPFDTDDLSIPEGVPAEAYNPFHLELAVEAEDRLDTLRGYFRKVTLAEPGNSNLCLAYSWVGQTDESYDQVDEESARFLTKGTILHNSSCSENLGNFNYDGHGIFPKNLEFAEYWYRKSISFGSISAGQGLYNCLLDSNQHDKCDEARDALAKVVYEGSVDAAFTLALDYRFENLGLYDYTKSAQLFALALERGRIKAAMYLGEQYEYGLGVKKNFSYSKMLYEQAAGIGCDFSRKVLESKRLDQYIEVQKRFEANLRLAQQGNIKAIWNLIDSYTEGKYPSIAYPEGILFIIDHLRREKDLENALAWTNYLVECRPQFKGEIEFFRSLDAEIKIEIEKSKS